MVGQSMMGFMWVQVSGGDEYTDGCGVREGVWWAQKLAMYGLILQYNSFRTVDQGRRSHGGGLGGWADDGDVV